MADEERFLEEDVAGTEEVDTGRRVGLLPGLLLKVLKWAALIVAAIIFIVTVVVVTVRILDRGGTSQSYAAVSTEYEGKRPVYEWYTNIDEVRARTADETPYMVIVQVAIGYEQNNKAVQTELIDRTPRLRDLIRRHLSSKTREELQPAYEQVIKEELRELINRIMTSGKVRDVIFLEYNVIEL